MKEIFGKDIDPRITKGSQIVSIKECIKEQQQLADKLLSHPQIKIEKCFICGETKQNFIYNACGFAWIKCPNCGHMYKGHMPEYDFIRKSFNESTTEVYLNEKSIQYRLENIAKPKIDYMLEHYKFDKPGKWFDLATGVGDVPYLLRKMGWTVEATELYKHFIEFGAKTFNFTSLNYSLFEYIKIFNDKKIEPFDIVSAFGYYDLIPDPLEHFKITNRLLKIGGLVGINLPNNESFTGALIELKPNSSIRHIDAAIYSYYSKKSLFLALEKCGFEPLAIWWHGLDIHDLIIRLIEADSTYLDSRAIDILYDHYNSLQKVIDKARLSDLMLICAKKVKDV